MRTIAIGIGCAIWGLLVAGAAVAQDDDAWSRDGAYVLLQGHYFNSTRGGSVDFEGFGASGHFGYRFHPRWAAELQVDWTRFESEVLTPSPATNGVNLSLNAKFYLLTGRFQPYALFGLGGWQLQADEEFLYRAGFGFDMYGSDDDTMALNLEFSFVDPTGEASALGYLSVGWGFLFRF